MKVSYCFLTTLTQFCPKHPISEGHRNHNEPEKRIKLYFAACLQIFWVSLRELKQARLHA